MKLSSVLLQTLMVGISGAGFSACTFLDDKSPLHLDTCTEECVSDHKKSQDDVYYDCPACGMG